MPHIDYGISRLGSEKLFEPTRVTDHIYSSVVVVAGPLEFCGRAYGVFMGPCRETREAAFDDAKDAAELIDAAGFAGAQAAQSMIR